MGDGWKELAVPPQRKGPDRGPRHILAERDCYVVRENTEGIGGAGMRYVVSKDDKSGLWYVHLEGFAYVPVFGSFRKTKRAAERIARERNQTI